MGRERYRRFKERDFDAWKAQQRLAYMKLDHADQREKRRARHAKNLETGRFPCEVCGSFFPSKANLDAHLATGKHRDRVNGDAPTERSAHAIRLAKLAAEAREAKKYYCGVFDHKSGTLFTLNTHCKGNPHLRAVTEYEKQNPDSRLKTSSLDPNRGALPRPRRRRKLWQLERALSRAKIFVRCVRLFRCEFSGGGGASRDQEAYPRRRRVRGEKSRSQGCGSHRHKQSEVRSRHRTGEESCCCSKNGC
ncbi:hypothetical protein VTI28DRAFT_7103 [Corynascus sepedonium]